jgi:hypothetical protein
MNALHDFLFAHPVASEVLMVRPQAAVFALAHAEVGDLDQAPQVDGIAYILPANGIGPAPEILKAAVIFLPKPSQYLARAHL